MTAPPLFRTRPRHHEAMEGCVVNGTKVITLLAPGVVAHTL